MKKNLQLLFMIVLSIVASLQYAQAQERTITGTVTDDSGGVLPGASIVLKGTTIGTTTDADGNYGISLSSDGGTLIYSFVGSQSKEIAVGGQSVINVSLSSMVLAEVIVTAVGIEREKRALGYAVTELGADEISQKSEPDIIKSLQGKVAGVNIVGVGGSAGAETKISIRGNSSLLGNNQPLYVVDGVPFDNTTYATGGFTTGTARSGRGYDLDPNNVESMTVLKGAAAAALYGSRASNGVIVITTKAGKKMQKKGLEVSLNTSYSVEEVSNLPEYQTRYTQGNNFLYVDGNFGTWGAPFDLNSAPWQVPQNAALIKSIDPATGKAWVAHPYDRYAAFPQFANDSVLLQTYNTPKDFFRTGRVLETALSITGGNEKANFTAGVSRSKNEGFVPGNEAIRTGVNLSGNVQLDNGLFVIGSINYVQTELTTPPISGLGTGGTSVLERILFTPPNVNAKGLPLEDAKGDGYWYRPDNDNPYYLVKYAPYTQDVDRWYGKLSVGYDIYDWLNITYQAGFNGFTQKAFEVQPISTNNQPTGRLLDDRLDRLELDGNLLITADRDLSEDISLKAIIGHNANKRTIDRQAYQGIGLIVRNLNDLDNTTTVTPFGGGKSERAYQAVFADLSFSYKNWGFLNLTGRNDWTSALPESERSYFYGGVSVAGIFTEALDVNSKVLTFGKLRISYGRVGSDPSPYLTQQINYFTNTTVGNNIASIGYPFTAVGGSIVNAQNIGNTLGNPNLTPEFTTEFEIGTDLRFFEDRIGLEFTYYDRSTTDQIVTIQTPSTSGFGASVENIGEITNKGIEIGLNIMPVKLNDFYWNVYTTFTRNRNEVVKLKEGLKEVFINGFGNAVRVVHREGLPYGQLLGSVAARDDQGNLLIDPATGKLITATTEEIIGDPNPDFLLGVSNTFSYKGFSLDILVDYKHGGDIYSDTYAQVYGRGLTPGTIPDNPRGREITVVIPGVLGDPTTQQPLLDDSGNTIKNGTQLTVNDFYFINTFASAGPEEFSVFDGTTIRLREVSLGYNLPKNILDKTPFGSAYISLTGRNLWFKAVNFPDDLNFDPETSSLGGNGQGIDYGIVPTSKRYGINLKLTF